MTLPQHAGPDAGNRDERLGEAVETYLELAESGRAPDPEAFLSEYPDLADELREALDGLMLVQGLVGSGVGPGGVGARRLEPGYRVAGYRIVRELGRGGMGVVYEAVHVDLDRPVALKIFGGHAAPGSSGRRRFLNEAKTAAGLHHTHIVPVFDVGQVGGLCYYAMQRIEGAGIDRVLRALRRDRLTASGSSSGRGPSTARGSGLAFADRSADASGLLSVPGRTEGGGSVGWSRSASGTGPLGAGAARDDRPPPFVPPVGSEYYRWVARVGQQAAEALAYAHRRGVIHRDVKPSNLLVDARGTVWVADFGLARRLEDPGQTRGDGLVGTPRYMSPEQAEGRPVGPETDVYSLGATLYEMLTLRPPFDGQSAAELVRQIADREPPPPRRFARRLPRDLETIVLKAMAKRPADRYASAAALAEDLGRFLAFEPVEARRISPVGRCWRLARRHPAATIISTLAAVAILATATVAYVRVANERDRALGAERQLAAMVQKERAAVQKERAARAGELLSQLPVLRASTMTRRREAGRAKLQEAAKLAPDEAMRLQLRDEAVGLLAARDVEDRPSLPIGWARDLVPIQPDGDGPAGPVAALSLDGQTLTLWDIEGRRPPIAHQLSPPAPPGFPGEQGDDQGRRPRWAPPWPAAALAGRSVAVADPDGTGVLLVEPRTGSTSRLELNGARIVGLLAPPGGRRLVTVEVEEARRGGSSGPEEQAPRGARDGQVRFRVRLWDLEGSPGQVLATLDELEVDPSSPWEGRPMVAVGPEGRTVVLGRSSPESRVVIYDAEDGGRLLGFNTGLGMTALAAGPDGLVVTAGDGRVQLWEVDPWSGAPPVQLPGLSEPRGGYVQQLRVSPSGRLLAAVGFSSGVELWDPAANALVAVVSTPTAVQDVAFADERTLLIASGPTTEVWSIAEPIGRVAFEFAADAKTRLPAFGPGGELVMPLLDEEPRLWPPEQCPTRARDWNRPEVHAAAVVPGPGGLLLAFGPDGLARFDAAPDASPLDVLPWPAPAEGPSGLSGSVLLLAQSPDHRAALLQRAPADPRRRSRRDAEQLWLWRADDRGGPGVFSRLRPPRGFDLRLLPPLPDPSSLPAEGIDLIVLAEVGGALRARAFDGEGRMIRDVSEADLLGDDGRAAEIAELKALLAALAEKGAASPRPGDWERAASSVGDLLGLGPIAFGRSPRPDSPPPPFVPAAVLDRGGHRLYFLDRGELHAWTLDGDRPEPIAIPSFDRLRSLAIRPDGRLLALGAEGGVVLLVSTADGRVVSRIEPDGPAAGPGPARRASALAFSPDGSLLAIGDNAGSLDLWLLSPSDSSPPRRLFRLPGRRNSVVGLVFSPDGRRLASVDGWGSENRVVEAWDLAALRDELAALGLGW
ncbi:WD40 repeat domain-containing serine/threonine protein kinase [Tautonia sociabilis]|uniref:non-specific serine/threonine protein kinase n=1 Tax=Tautonia sociabilis TaxID=2080755 RepID=A0A432MDL7_9BACT|nr:serine/threonine-protein kinase [Tautonia sociabilis]RUL82933.1 hypothetical protein TsocGM_23040 [Tautonia sociabilis]